MANTPEYPLRVFYDGSCIVCATEIEHYLRQDHGGRLVAVDIAAPEFDPVPFQITLDRFMYELHAVDRSGVVYRGVEAFQAIWQAFPNSLLYATLNSLAALPLVNPMARLLYKGFARIRPYLPKRNRCHSGTCRIGTFKR
ncbi:MAG: thiol-disulfide oxidoreductase DCC family protein [Desulfuromonadaceae bacterium]